MLSVFIYNANTRYDSGLTISLTVNKNESGNDLVHEFVKHFDEKERIVGLNNVEHLYLYQVLPTLRSILQHNGLDSPVMDILSVVDSQDSMSAVTIDYLL